MMLGYKIANSIINFWHDDLELLDIHLNLYRKKFLKNSIYKNGYKKNILKGTPKNIEIIFAAFDRKINCKPLFKNNDEKIKDYFAGIDIIYNKYYSMNSKFQKASNIEKYDLYVTNIYTNNYINYIFYKPSKTGKTFICYIDENLKKKFLEQILTYEDWIKKGYHLS